MTSKLKKIEIYCNNCAVHGDVDVKTLCEEILRIVHGQDFDSKLECFSARGQMLRFKYAEIRAWNRLRQCEGRRLHRFITLKDLQNPDFKVNGLGKDGRTLVLAQPEKFIYECATK